jgi:hypothetical protein
MGNADRGRDRYGSPQLSAVYGVRRPNLLAHDVIEGSRQPELALYRSLRSHADGLRSEMGEAAEPLLREAERGIAPRVCSASRSSSWQRSCKFRSPPRRGIKRSMQRDQVGPRFQTSNSPPSVTPTLMDGA